MTFEQMKTLINILQTKTAEGIELLKDTPINSTEFNTTLNNVIAATSIAAKFNIELHNITKKQEEKGEA